MMKKLRKKDIRRINDVVYAHNKEIDAMKDALRDILGDELWTPFTQDVLYSNMDKYYMTYPEAYIGKTMDDVKNDDAKKSVEANSAKERLILEFEKYRDNCEKNKVALKEFYENEPPLFIVIKPISIGKYMPKWRQYNPNDKYCFCYEFKDTEDDGIYVANIFPSRCNYAYNTSIDYRECSVRQMTEYEFEHEYIINRINGKHFDDEAKLVEFDNNIRRLFHGQRNII